MKISFIGLGKLGMPCAEVIAQKGHIVTGYDIASRGNSDVLQFPTIQSAINGVDIVFIAVPTPHDPDYDGRAPTAHLEPKDFQYNIVKEVIIEANKHMTKNQLLVLISTVLPGTVRREFVPLVTNTRFVYNPYLIAMGTVAWDMVNPEMVMIGTEDGTETGDAKQLVDFYKSIMENNPRYVIGTWDECECIKVFYNTFISAKIGLVNMIQDVAQRQGNINVDVVTDALANSDQRIMGPSYMKAGMGDGGACHPRDNIALRYMAKNLHLDYDIFDSIMNARESQARNMAIEILKHGNRIQFSSDSYKPNVEYIDGSYSLLVQHYVKELGGWVVNENPSIFVRVHDTDVVPENVVVFDPWRTYNGPNTVIYYGNTRHLT
jgi:UDPglucose 6-dehydrogenase|tara:strand:+ start:4302 stop:5432 length:1131 start_codon:yes stop_codon:yes gene_type:complete